MKKEVKKNNFWVGVFVGIVISVIIVLSIYFIKGSINDNKCYVGYYYDETHKICSKRKQTLTDENGRCPYDYGYNEYDNTCVQYDEYKP